MKDKFCNYIKEAKVGDIFFNIDGLKYIITKTGKKITYAVEIWGDKREEIQWNNTDTDKVIY